MVQLNWTAPARQDLQDIFRYYDALSHEVATSYAEELLKAGDDLEQMPEMGQKEPTLENLGRNYRYLLVLRRYKLIYLYENNACSILMIWDCKKNPKTMRKNIRKRQDNSRN